MKCESAADADVSADGDAECRRPTSPFKARDEPSGLPSCLSSGILRVYRLESFEAKSSIIFFYY
jgi:hypothetical protein